MSEFLAIAMVVAVCAALLAGYPVALTLGGGALLFAFIGHAMGSFDLALLGALPQRIFGVMTNEVLIAIPLFVFMGVMLERARIAEDLLESLGRLFGRRRGGLGIAVVLVGVLLAAAKGVVGATVVTIGLITLPTMLRHGYDKKLAAGTVAATATLAQVMPPATVLVLLGDQLNIAYQSAQLGQGNFAPRPLAVSDLFAGALLPALTLVGLYLLYLTAVAVLAPHRVPAVPAEPDAPHGLARWREIGRALLAPLSLIAVVLGSILIGLATPTEAAAIGAVGAILLAAQRVGDAPRWPAPLAVGAFGLVVALRGVLDVRLGHGGVVGFVVALILVVAVVVGVGMAVRSLARTDMLRATLTKTAEMTAMIFVILIGASAFSLVFRGFGGDDMVAHALGQLPGGAGGAVLAVMVAMFLLGFVLDAFEIIFVVVPIVAPALLKLPGVDPVWLGVLMAVNLQTSYMHPPLGPTLFYLRGVAPPEISTRDIYLGIVPFVAIQLFALIVLWFLPGLATALPRALYGG